MLAVLFLVANAFASMTVLLTMLGAISHHKLKVDTSLVLSIVISFAFIFLAVIVSLAHPWVFVLYGLSMVGFMMFGLGGIHDDMGYSMVLAVLSFLFWSQMTAVMIFNAVYILPKVDNEGD